MIRFIFAVACWLVSIPALLSSLVFSLAEYGLLYFLTTCFAWFALLVMTLGWIGEYKVSKFWPVAGTITGLAITFTVALFFSFTLIYALPSIALAGCVARYHMQPESHDDNHA